MQVYNSLINEKEYYYILNKPTLVLEKAKKMKSRSNLLRAHDPDMISPPIPESQLCPADHSSFAIIPMIGNVKG